MPKLPAIQPAALRKIRRDTETATLQERNALALLSSPKGLDNAWQEGVVGLIKKTDPRTIEALGTVLGGLDYILGDRITCKISRVDSGAGLYFGVSADRVSCGADFTGSPDAAIDSSLDVCLQLDHRWVHKGVSCRLYLYVWHRLDSEDEETLRRIGVIKDRYVPGHSEIEVSCEI
jgi:hypothetical protein